MPTAAFLAAYDAVLAQWPVPFEAVDVASPHGATHVTICGPADAQPLVLLPGGGATSAVWIANVEAFSRDHRGYAVDIPCDAGRSVHNGRPFRGHADLMTWLDSLFVHFGLTDAHLCGHSYGAAIALGYAIHSPRVSKLVLLDPTRCFAGLKPTYLLHALPLLLKPTPQRQRDHLRWETGGLALNPAWLELTALAAPEFPAAKVARTQRPRLDQLRTPTLVLLAEHSKAHDIHRVDANAHRSVPHIVSAVLPGVSHHSIPMHNPADLNDAVTEFVR